MIRRNFQTLLLLASLGSAAWAQSITIPNASFELPATTYVDLALQNWQKTAKPDWWIDEPPYTWDTLVGVFANPPPAAYNHIDNMHGTQAVWLFGDPDCGIYQELTATYEAGKAYFLTVGICGRGGPMPDGSPLELSLYYNQTGVQKTTAATTVLHTLEAFPNHTHFFDYQVQLPRITRGDPAIGKKIGIQFLSLVEYNEDEVGYGGYWDLDNVRLVAIPVPDLLYSKSGNNIRVAWPSTVGFQYQVKVSTDMVTWGDLDTPMAGTGGELFKLYPLSGRAFFRVTITPTP